LSLKNNIDMVREELNSEEKFFEKAVVTEKFIKKYKNIMIATIVVIVIGVGSNIAYTMNNDARIVDANQALTKLNTDPTNSAEIEKLKSLSPALFDAWSYSQAISSKDIESLKKLQNSKTVIVGDLASYEVAQNTKDIQMLEGYASKQDSIYKDLAQVQSAILLLNEDKIELAHQKLLTISQDSSLFKVATALLHYGVK
jgi:hypothetical protein